DLFAVLDSLRAAAPKRAARLMEKLINAAQQLGDFPESGRHPLDITDDERVRELVVERLRLFYLYAAETQLVHIIAVFDARRDVADLVQARLSESSE
ncbi:MAG TPA: type II toxin-antitoxin system RelE/ParE family toxin, partial [Anaerolineae bacterium]